MTTAFHTTNSLPLQGVDGQTLLTLVGQYTELEPQAGGRYWLGLCPVHTDHRPSFSVQPSEGIWKCFTCQKGGDAVAFLQFVEHCSEMEALLMLKEQHGHLFELGNIVKRALEGREHGKILPVPLRARRDWVDVLEDLKREAFMAPQEEVLR